jgi:hypothetical protein
VLNFGSGTERFGTPAIPPLHFTASSLEPPQAAQFRIAINAAGEVRYCFLDGSSGDAALDQQAHAYLVQCRFPAPSAAEARDSDTRLLWTTATVEWGNDVAAPQATAVPTPKP